MCGIHLYIQKGNDKDVGRNVIDRMLSATRHRGPDGMDWKHLDWDDEQIWLGHNLLAITDSVENSRQPMIGNSGDFGIIFNGQIYNHLELRKEIIQEGINFKTDSDTETLLYWVKTFGRKGLRKLKGMFAFVFWDSQKRLLIIHRDSFGIKPLYFARNRNNFVLSSEPVGVFSSELFNLKFDPNSGFDLLQYRHIQKNETPWFGLKELNPGETIEYWENKPMHYFVQTEQSSSAHSKLEDSINEGFNETIPQNIPVGLMLSGGIDSTIILDYCIKNKIKIIPYSVRFNFGEKEDFEDEEAVKFLETLYEIEVSWININKADLSDYFENLINQSPFVADTAWFLSYKIAERAKIDGIKVLLSGAGADELFGGYRRHWFFFQWKRFQSFIPDSLQRYIFRNLGMKNFRKSNAEHLFARNIWEMALSSGLTSELKKSTQSTGSISGKEFTLEDALIWDQTHFLVNDVLKITDLATMAHGIEGRFPFLHPSIKNYANQFSGIERLKNGRKWMLKEILEPITGSKFVNRKKRGFGLPIGTFFTSETGRKIVIESLNTLEISDLFKENSWEKTKAELISYPEKWVQEIHSICLLSKFFKKNKP
jgi:asparagine synthase (glutamine-hydrolysing)